MLNPLSSLKHPVLLCLYFISSWSYAQTYSSASSGAVAGAGRAAVEASDVNYLNPAALVHAKGRYIYSSWSREDLSVGLSETGRDVVLPASFSYFVSNSKNNSDQDVQVQEFRLSVADFIFDRLAIGLTGNDNTSKINGVKYNQTNANIGLFFTPTDRLGVAWVFYNTFEPRSNIPEDLRLRPQMAFGVNTIYQNILRARFDVLSSADNNFGKAIYMGGFETLWNEWMTLRLGYKNDIKAEQELFTQGLGFNGPVFAMNYSHQGNIKGKDFDRHSIDLLISF
ncbi:MAG: hypothetical protein IPM97_16690 [Bdellovibrionaceae bacterium]|nr:hypothetical protein [Pseudobdellovibrionaceae bacterium]